ncbi:MAG TPA: ammonium transporter [Candidatus Methanofastidiosa archaeon]|nr:ammonium transporter [Candidatus Methanofastidiosa archaeon]
MMIEVNYVDTLWVLMASGMVFMMHLGFATIEAGFTRAKNTVSILMKNISTVFVGSFVFCLIGFSLAFSGDGAVIGNLENVVLRGLGTGVWDGLTIPGIVFFFFQMMFAATAATIVSGAVAERIKFGPYLIITCILVAFVYPMVAHWIWGGGWLAKRGFIDFAGSTVVHSVGGWAALASAMVLGPRLGKFTLKGEPRAIPGHNMGLATIGLFVLWFGWFGFNGGSELALDDSVGPIIANTFLAAIVAGLSTMLLTWKKMGKPDTGMTMNGILAGLVAITAPCASVSSYWALFIGGVAGILVVYAVDFFESRMKIDDPVGAISVHGVNGLWGTLSVGLFATGGGLFTTGSIDQLLTQMIGAGATFLVVFPAMFILAKVIDRTIGIRVSKFCEISGLDSTEFGGAAYPDFVRG